MIIADLHIHSHISDGSVPKSGIFQEAAKANIQYMAFAEHDTFDGMAETLQMANRYGVKTIPAIEISAFHYGRKKKVHILCYGAKNFALLEDMCRPLLRQRHKNSKRQIMILKDQGYKISVEDVLPYTYKYIYKQHICEHLQVTGQIETLFGDFYQETFKNGGPCDFDIEYLDAFKVLAAVHEAGGIAVVAHPGESKNFAAVEELISLGLDGLELHHSSHSEHDKKIIKELCQKHGLIMTGGSDFHGKYTHRPVELFSHGLDEQELAGVLSYLDMKGKIT